MTPRTSRTQIFEIFAAGFKSIRDHSSLVIGPLTILAGANSSGKSSILQPLLLVKQTLEAPYDPGALLISGANTSFSAVTEMLWKQHGLNGADAFEFGLLNTTSGMGTALRFGKADRGLRLDLMRVADERGIHEVSPQSSQAELARTVPEYLQELFAKLPDADKVRYVVKRNRAFFDIITEPLGVPTVIRNELETLATNLIHLPGLRGVPERFYPATEVGSAYPGSFQPYTASVLARWADTRDPRLREIGRQLGALGLTWKVEAKRIDDTRVTLRVGRLSRGQRGGSRDLVNIADVGLGVSQTLPILAALLAAQPGQLVYLEQPEIHLHPRAQVALADILLDASGRGVIVVAETHSSLLIRALQEAVVRRKEPVGTVHMHWFTRDEEGATQIASTELDEAGAFGEWPVDFADVELDVEDRYLTAVMD